MRKKFKIIFILFIVIGLFFTTGLFAKEDVDLQVFLSVGGLMINDTDDLNSELKKYGYQEVSNVQATIGGGIRLNIERLLIGVEGHGFSSKTKTSGNYETSYRGGYGILEFGYVVFTTGGLRVFPLLGIGGGGFQYDIYEKDSPEFDEVMANPGRGSQISTGSMIVSISIGIEYFINITGKGGVVIGVQAGYNQALYNRDWTLFGVRQAKEETVVKNGPELEFTGAHAQINIGWAFLL